MSLRQMARQVGKTETTKLEIIEELEIIYKKWITDNASPKPKQLLISKIKYEFLSPIELYKFIQGARFMTKDNK